jgi:hypothetical protein
MRILIASLLVLLSACAPIAGTAPTGQPSASAPPTATSVPATEEPLATAGADPARSTPPPQADGIAVALAPAPFPILPSLALHLASVTASDEESARVGVMSYLEGLDRYRETGQGLPVGGRFGEVVAAGLASSARPGVTRKFELESLGVEQLWKKPWGTPAYAEVRVTIVDKAVGGAAPDERETGRLRLVGDRLRQVFDGWDASAGRWFNGRPPDDLAGLRGSIADAVGMHLHSESWAPGSAVQTSFTGPDATPYRTARVAYIRSFDRVVTLGRTFIDVRATIERFDTFAEVGGGIATVRITATAVATDASGLVRREPYARQVKVFFGNWMPEVADEEISPGVWRSGGELALEALDINRA